MKKILLLTGALIALSTVSASADLIIQPTFVTPGSPTYVTEPYVHPEYHPRYERDRRHNYNWQYWRDHGHDKHDNRGHDDHGNR